MPSGVHPVAGIDRLNQLALNPLKVAVVAQPAKPVRIQVAGGSNGHAVGRVGVYRVRVAVAVQFVGAAFYGQRFTKGRKVRSVGQGLP